MNESVCWFDVVRTLTEGQWMSTKGNPGVYIMQNTMVMVGNMAAGQNDDY